MQLISLGAGGSVKLRVGDSYSSKPRHRRKQRLLFVVESAFLARINEDGPLRARSANGSSQQHPGGDQVAERGGEGIDGDADRRISGKRASSQIGCELQPFAIEASTCRRCQLR